jgi:uncharacterized integral membrane protein (TIGR00697 family)
MRSDEIQEKANRFYVLLCGIFIASLIASNLIFQKFFMWDVWIPFIGDYTFELSVGILPYPITFLVTDIISEIYGRKKANQVVISGFISSIFIMGIILVADATQATLWSPVDDAIFTKVFGLFGLAVFASMTAYLMAQFIDIRVFHFWKKLTKNKHLWLRNNGSTVFSQLVDTSTVLFLLCYFSIIPWDKFFILFVNGFLFKMLIALLDTPLFYLFSGLLRKKFKLELGEELN